MLKLTHQLRYLRKLSLFRPPWVMVVVALILSCALTEIIYHNKLLDRAENLYTDLWHQIKGKRFEAKHVSLVLIDEYSLNQLADTPLTFWTPYFAKVVGALRDNGAKVVGIDLLFSASAEQWLRRFNNLPESVQNYDRPLREEINKGKVVLVTSTQQLGNGYDGFVLPITDIMFSLPDLEHTEKYLGLSDLTSDNDSVYRRYLGVKPLNLSPQDQANPPAKYTFAALLALHAQYFNAASELAINRMTTPRPIVFSGPPGSIPKLSFYPLLQAIEALPASENPADRALPSSFSRLIKDRVVIIGSDYVGLNDIHTTPYGVQFFDRLAQPMSGPEIQANIAETIMSDRKLMPIGDGTRRVLMFILLLFAAVLFRNTNNNVIGGSVFLIMLLMCAGIGYGTFHWMTLFPTATLQMSFLFMFVFIYGLRFMGETRKRQHIQSMFGRYVSKEVVDQLMETDEAPPLGGVSYDVTVLFSDIRNFTSLSEILEPHEVVEMINQYLMRAVPRVQQFGGSIDKFIGDAIMAEFGAPVKRADHALSSIRAALAMKKNAEDFREWFHTRFPQLAEFEFNIGIGINSGPAIMGNIGSLEKREYTALGDTVNIASRLEGITKQMGWPIVASDATVQAAGDKVITGGRDQITVKGRREPITVHEILGVRD